MQITVYSKTVCPYCVAAKNWLKTNNYEYEEVLIDSDDAKQRFIELVGPDVRTVPQIFVDGERIGGYSELIKSSLVKS